MLRRGQYRSWRRRPCWPGQKRQRICQRSSRLPGILPGDQNGLGHNMLGIASSHQNGPTYAEHQAADVHRAKRIFSFVAAGDDQIGRAGGNAEGTGRATNLLLPFASDRASSRESDHPAATYTCSAWREASTRFSDDSHPIAIEALILSGNAARRFKSLNVSPTRHWSQSLRITDSR
jgi:hypothetical protein